MAYIYEEVSRTFSEYLLIPNLTTEKCTPDNIDLSTPLVKFKKDEECSFKTQYSYSIRHYAVGVQRHTGNSSCQMRRIIFYICFSAN